MNKISFNADECGQAFSLDIILALVLITVILGVSADAIDIASHKSSDYSARFSLERVTTDAADMLIKTSGSPDNWEIYSDISATPGLADISPETKIAIPNTLSMKKINSLKNNYNSLIYGKILPYGANSSMIIYPSDASMIPICILNNSPSTSASEIAVANRTVLIPLIYLETIIYSNIHKGSIYEEICPNSYHTPTNSSGEPKWACKHFNITLSELNTTDFYVITDSADIGDNSPTWIIDRPERASNNETEEHFSQNAISINQKIVDLLGNDAKGVLWFHVKTPGNKDRNFDAYIVSAPKGTPQEQVNINNLNPTPWFFVLHVWY
ncbi:hypothetical protein [Methanobacterium sp. ACI-7]|uniref:hypothetical protein n=1 Tax=unclassified Methanobacterium TaxID=2627676 RepID=UPI0039C412F9